MKLLIAAITFAATLGVLFLIEADKTPKEDSARIIEALTEESPSASISTTPTPIKSSRQSSPSPQNGPANRPEAPTVTQTATPAPAPSHTPSRTPTPAPTHAPTPSRTPTPTPVPVPASPSPSPTPSETPLTNETPTPTSVPTSSPAAAHTFYTSSYPTAKKYYCDTDNDWKTLSPKYLKSFPSEEELLASYPNRTLDDPCK